MPHQLDDPVPDLPRHIFPSCRVPRVAFGESAVEVRVPQSSACVDTTLGSGLAVLHPCTAEQRLQLLALLHELNGGRGLIRRAELRLIDDADREVLQAALERYADGQSSIEPTISLPARVEALDRARGLRVREVGLRWRCSALYPVADERERPPTIASLRALLDATLDAGFRPRLELIDVCRSDIGGFVVPALVACLEHGAKRGAPPLRLRVCDTFGLCLPWCEVPAPRSLPRLLRWLWEALGLPPEQVELQAHDDLGMALPNSIAGVMHGCGSVVGSLGGVGERAGLAPTELLLVHLGGLYGVDSDLTVVGRLLDMLRQRGLGLAARHPLWGDRALVSCGDVDRQRLDSTPELGAPLNTPCVLGRAPRVEG
jgi:2-phosphinomethylmalic acid synthase